MKKLTLEQFLSAHTKDGEEMTGTQFAAAVGLYNAYDMGFKEGVICMEYMLEKLAPGLQELANGNRELLQDMLTYAVVVFGTANKAYEKGESDRENGADKLSSDEFIDVNPNLKDECCADMVDILFSAYIKGYRGVKPINNSEGDSHE
ncbi:MAG: hypothetical protein FWE04_01605 [Oscillospiraceae bacterium]|nr:hypothetical protein [Oscillospiraceae bacterium]